MNVNANLMEENVIEINGGITLNVDVTVKNITYMGGLYLESSYM